MSGQRNIVTVKLEEKRKQESCIPHNLEESLVKENQRLLTTEERVSENDDSALEISKVDALNDGHETQLSPVSLESPTHPRLNNKESSLSNANEGIL